MSLFIADAIAATTHAATTHPQGNPMSSMLMLGGFMAIFYFLLWRPQNKRAKQHRELMDKLSQGDEIVTNGGMLGKVSKIDGDFVTLSIASQVEVVLQKSAVASVLPKGTIKA